MTEVYSIPRFRRTSYSRVSGYLGPGKWHIARYRYERGLFYTNIEALCGYTVKSPWLASMDYKITKRPPTGEHCAKCKDKLKKMDQEEEASNG